MMPATRSAAQKDCDTVSWSASNKLVSADFRDVADTGKTMIAFTLTKFSYKVIPQDGAAVIRTSTIFYPCGSWLNRTNTKNSIAHEQLHFDITEYYKRLFLKRVSETRSSEDMFALTTKAIFRDIAEQKRMMNAEYDKQCNFGLNAQQQNKWNAKIEALLASLQSYAGNTTTINFK